MDRAEKRRQQKEARKKGAGSAAVTPDEALFLENVFADAVSHYQQGRLGEAEQGFLTLQGRQPDIPDVLHMLALIALQTERPGEAVNYLEKAIAAQPQAPDYFLLLGAALKRDDRVEDAIPAYERAISLDPGLADAHYNLGNTFKELNREQDAIACYQRAIEIDPAFIDAHCNLAQALNRTGRFDEAIASSHRTLALRPDIAEAHINLGVAFHNLGQLDAAADSFQKALVLRPDIAQVHTHLGNVFRELERPEDSLASFRQALAIDPEFADAHKDLGNALLNLGLLDDAVASFQKALAVRPDFTEVNIDLGRAQMELRQFDDAMASYQKALAGNPDDAGTQNIYLHGLLYLPQITNPELFDACRRILGPGNSPGNSPGTAPPPVPGRGSGSKPRLRIGYLSSDFRNHPVGNNILPLLANHDHDGFEIFCYAQLAKSDSVTEQFRGHADRWLSINGLTDARVAERIREDGIDVMVFLGGNFDRNRPAIASHRPAPVQVSMHGGTTSALDDMDYWLTDDILHPGDTTEQFTEDLFRLPIFYAYPLPEDAPPVSPLPADKNDFITFASFNKLSKINNDVIDLWSKILAAVPDARLNLKFWNYLESPSLRRGLLERFEGNGIEPERIRLLGASEDPQGHLAQYHQVDIALDPFPFSGATTTFQALWMGVPVVSLLGERFISRMGGSLTAHAGLEMLAAASPDEYVEIAVALAQDRPRLRELRTTLRGRVAASPLCDGPAYARNVEDAFRSMWRTRSDAA